VTNHFPDTDNMVDDEWQPRPKYACSDQMCGAEPRTDWGFKCGSGPVVAKPDRSIRCRDAEVARLTKERDEARESVKRLEAAWIPASTKPEGYERRVLLWVVWQDFGWRDQPEAKIGWWKHGPGCFAFDEFENADHLVTHWMEITDPTEAKEAKP
jgi:hypothetical protein